jgi:hypothetical protein
MKKVKETTNGNKNGNSQNGKKPKKEVIKEFDFAEANSSKAVRSMIKVMTMTRKRLYPERYDEKGNLKPEYAKNKVVI